MVIVWPTLFLIISTIIYFKNNEIILSLQFKSFLFLNSTNYEELSICQYIKITNITLLAIHLFCLYVFYNLPNQSHSNGCLCHCQLFGHKIILSKNLILITLYYSLFIKMSSSGFLVSKYINISYSGTNNTLWGILHLDSSVYE